MDGQVNKRIVAGIFAHVDAGKTTLNEALLYRCGVVRTLGSVDAKDSHLDYHALEQQRGITIYAKQTTVMHSGAELTLIDTPGHVDFAGEAQRVLDILDCAILLIDANSGIQGHALTLWHLLEQHAVPTVLFVNKMDFAHSTREELLADFQNHLSEACIDFTDFKVHHADDGETRATITPSLAEACATASEDALDEYLETDSLSLRTLQHLLQNRAVFPCFFGSALKQDGVDELVDGVTALVAERSWPQEFSARVFKITHDPSGTRLTWLKVTGGQLKTKQLVNGIGREGAWSQKVDQIRRYNGSKYTAVPCVDAGQVCAVTGLTHTRIGSELGHDALAPVASQSGSNAQGRGTASGSNCTTRPSLVAPAFSNSVRPLNADVEQLHAALKLLTDEDPLLNVRWDERLQELQVQLMGAVQLEILQATLRDRFGLDVEFGPSSVLYRETIAQPVTGIGHFEPLRHYAEVHLLLEPLPRGSGVEFGTCCHVDQLDLNWQRLILTNAMEREHVGVLTGSPITDLRITLIAGRAHNKHTEGGDFRQATYRAIRQGLMQAQSVLLEPWERFWLRVPADHVGRALSDLQRMSARMEAPSTRGGYASIEGSVPAKEIRDYPIQLASYSRGKGSISLQFDGYEPCHDADAVIAQAAYDPEADLVNTPDSVFCSHGAGHTVKWNEVQQHAQANPDPGTYTAWREATPEFFGRERS